MGKTHYKPLEERHGRGTAWARHDMCESALIHGKKAVITTVIVFYQALLDI
jgi:hypothetical protein